MQWTSELCSSGRGRLFRGGWGYPFIAEWQAIFMDQYNYFGSSVKGGNLGLRLARTDF